MNPSELTARSARKIEIGETPAIHAERDRLLEPTAKSPLTSNFATDRDAHRLSDEVSQLRYALIQVLSRETGQEMQILQSPVVNNARLCAIADNIWHHRHWST